MYRRIFEVSKVSMKVGKQWPNNTVFLFDLKVVGSLKEVVYETVFA